MMKVAWVTSEAAPFCKTGGLADVSRALPRALLRGHADIDLHLFLPLYREVKQRLVECDLEVTRLSRIKADGRFLSLRRDGQPTVHFFDSAAHFDRDGLYGPTAASEYPDNAHRFASFCRAVLAAAPRLLGGEPEIYHVHDWQTALLPVLLGQGQDAQRAATVLTIHNAAFQGNFAKATMPELGLDWALFTQDTLEFYDQVSFLKGGIVFADAVTTVSPSYARELLAPAGGMGLDGILRVHDHKLTGILNGIDTEEWNPATDHLIAHPYSVGEIAGKRACRQALLAEFGLPDDDRSPVAAVVSRLTDQKGIDLLVEVTPRLVAAGAQLVVVGMGEPTLEAQLQQLAATYPEQVSVRIVFDEDLIHRVQAGADLFIMPSRFEPCGLTQLFAMRYGTLPVATAVGGLRDTVVDATGQIAGEAATGFLAEQCTAESLWLALARAVGVFWEQPSLWRRLIFQAMSRDWSWAAPAAAYASLYRAVVE